VLVSGELNLENIANLSGWSGAKLRNAPEPKYSDTWWSPLFCQDEAPWTDIETN
jgi:hypothetical protein